MCRVYPGYHGANQKPEYLLQEAKKIGFPVMVKAVKGGGGKGMRIALNEGEFLDKLESAKSEGRNSFGDDEMLVEKYIADSEAYRSTDLCGQVWQCCCAGRKRLQFAEETSKDFRGGAGTKPR